MDTRSRDKAPSGRRSLDDARGRAERAEDVYFGPFDVAGQNASQATGRWWIYVLTGLLTLGLGVFTLISRINGASTLVALVAVLLLGVGAVELVLAVVIRPVSWAAVITSVASILLGIAVLAWPGVTLVVLAAFVGIGLLTWGVRDIYLSVADRDLRPRSAGLVTGIVLVALGILVFVRRVDSVAVLAVLVGIFLVVQGVFSFVGGLRLLDLHRALKHWVRVSEQDDRTPGSEKLPDSTVTYS